MNQVIHKQNEDVAHKVSGTGTKQIFEHDQHAHTQPCSAFWTRMYSLVAAVLTVGLSSYFVAPMLPIYCVEPLSRGGLGWSRSDACSLYGTYIAVAHIAPFIGGFFADFLFGQTVSTLLGYLFTAYGLSLLWFFPGTMLVPGFLLFGLGTGCIKVSLATAVGKMCAGAYAEQRTRSYEYHYYMSCIGFIAGNFFSSLFFDLWGMNTLFVIGLGTVCISLVFYLFSKPQLIQAHAVSPEESAEPKGKLPSLGILLGVFVVSILFFACGNQLNSSISLFLHEQIDRKIFGFSIPILWFGVFGFIIMTALSSLRRKIWKPLEESLPYIELIKMAVGLALLSIGFLFFFGVASFSGIFGKTGTLLLLLVAMGFLFVSDVHVRPLLFSSASKYAHPKYHTMGSAIVYSTVGVGGKLAGMLAGTVDTIGFSWLFSICALVGALSCLMSVVLWKKQKLLFSRTFPHAS